jgi:hypothetical protein
MAGKFQSSFVAGDSEAKEGRSMRNAANALLLMLMSACATGAHEALLCAGSSPLEIAHEYAKKEYSWTPAVLEWKPLLVTLRESWLVIYEPPPQVAGRAPYIYISKETCNVYHSALL